MLGHHYLLNPSRMIDKFKLGTPDGTDYFPTIEAAQAAAQIDIERRVGDVYIRPKTDGTEQPSSYAAVHAHTIRKAASREDDNGNAHLAEELRAAMLFVEQAAG